MVIGIRAPHSFKSSQSNVGMASLDKACSSGIVMPEARKGESEGYGGFR